MKAIIALSLLVVLANAYSYKSHAHVSYRSDPVSDLLRGVFMEFQQNIGNATGCYNSIGGIYSSVMAIIQKIKVFVPNEIPRILAAITNVIYSSISLDQPCQVDRLVNETMNIINHPEVLKQRVDLVTLVTVLDYMQKGFLQQKFELVGRGLGLLLRKVYAFQL